MSDYSSQILKLEAVPDDWMRESLAAAYKVGFGVAVAAAAEIAARADARIAERDTELAKVREVLHEQVSYPERLFIAADKRADESAAQLADVKAQLAAANARIAELEAVFGEFGETDGKCKDCGSPVALVSGSTNWYVDEEVFGQNDDASDDLKRQAEDCRYDGVEIGGELSGHFCLNCRKLTSLYRHSF